ncbi:MAG: glycosyltransferase family 2 protein [bacterium]
MNDFFKKHIKVYPEIFPNKVTENPLVSVAVQTYQHSKYIKDCLDGILMQQTDFPFEVLLGEDESTDGTRDVCIEYAKKYPDKIRLFLHSRKNVIFINNRPTGRFNLLWNFENANGKYIAWCDGDDYWTDPLKLQKQADFLENNSDYGLTHTDCAVYVENKKKWLKSINKNLSNQNNDLNKKELFYELIKSTYKVRTSTAMFRKDLLSGIIINNYFAMVDTQVWLTMSQKTKFKYFDEVTCVYRKLQNSLSRDGLSINTFRFRLSSSEMRIYYCKLFKYKINTAIKNKYNNQLITYKIYKNDFKEKYPLINPTFIQKIRNNVIKINIIRSILRFEHQLRKKIYFLINS